MNLEIGPYVKNVYLQRRLILFLTYYLVFSSTYINVMCVTYNSVMRCGHHRIIYAQRINEKIHRKTHDKKVKCYIGYVIRLLLRPRRTYGEPHHRVREANG